MKPESSQQVRKFVAAHGNGQRELSHEEQQELATSMGLNVRQLPIGMRGGLVKIFFGDNGDG